MTFSKAMDQTSVANAWTSADLPAAQVTFSWNTAGDTLTVTPNQPLPVAMGTGLGVLPAEGTNVLVAAAIRDVPPHRLARRFLEIEAWLHAPDSARRAIALTAYSASGTQGEWSLPVARNSIDKKLHDAWTWEAFLTAAEKCNKAGVPFGSTQVSVCAVSVSASLSEDS